MIDKSIIDSVLMKYPSYHYELNSIEGNTEINIVRENKDKSGIGFHKIRKVLKHDEDLAVLDEILKGSD